jgi:malonyl-CoA O-methyltransferase
MDKKRIVRNFSRSAPFYDRYADMQTRCARELLGGAGRRAFGDILELGCGTGNYSVLLSERFKTARLTAVDMSAEMIGVAGNKLKGRGVEFLVADAEEISPRDDFDLITSNACFQWFENLERSLIRYKKMLKNNGLILFSMFGPMTFLELRSCVEALFKDRTVSAAHFATKEKITSLLGKHFAHARVEEKIYEETHPTLGALLQKIKYTGTIGEGFGGGIFLGPKSLRKLEAVYGESFGRIKATYQVFFCRGQKA